MRAHARVCLSSARLCCAVLSRPPWLPLPFVDCSLPFTTGHCLSLCLSLPFLDHFTAFPCLSMCPSLAFPRPFHCIPLTVSLPSTLPTALAQVVEQLVTQHDLDSCATGSGRSHGLCSFSAFHCSFSVLFLFFLCFSLFLLCSFHSFRCVSTHGLRGCPAFRWPICRAHPGGVKLRTHWRIR